MEYKFLKRYIERKSEKVKEILEKDINPKRLNEIENCFNYYLIHEKIFLDYYNKTVIELNKDEINFVEFGNQWRLLRSNKDFYVKFNKVFGKEYDKGINEIRKKGDIVSFYDKYCVPNEGKIQHSFCSKLFHNKSLNIYGGCKLVNFQYLHN